MPRITFTLTEDEAALLIVHLIKESASGSFGPTMKKVAYKLDKQYCAQVDGEVNDN